MICSVVLVSGVQQFSYIHIHISILFQILLPYQLLYHRILSEAPCAIHRSLLIIQFCFFFSNARFSFQTYRLFKAMFSLLVALVTQWCPTLCGPMDYSPPVSSVQGILQARILEWVAVSYSRELSQPRDRTWVSHIVGRFFTIWATRG